MHIPQRVMVALQNRLSCLLHKKNLNYRQRPYFRGPGGGAETRANGRVEYLFCLSFSLPLCHPRAWPAHARVILGRDEQEAESKRMKHEGNVNIYWQKRKVLSSQYKKTPPILFPSRDKGKTSSAFQRNMP